MTRKQQRHFQKVRQRAENAGWDVSNFRGSQADENVAELNSLIQGIKNNADRVQRSTNAWNGEQVKSITYFKKVGGNTRWVTVKADDATPMSVGTK